MGSNRPLHEKRPANSTRSGVYLAGELDVHDPRYADLDAVTLDAFDRPIQDYYHSVGTPEIRAAKPRRKMPANIRDLLLAVERMPWPNKTDAICAVLAWPSQGLESLGESLARARKKAVWDGGAHAVAVCHPYRSLGVAFACAYGRGTGLRDVLVRACRAKFIDNDVAEWVGFGVDLKTPWAPIVVYCPDTGRRQQTIDERSDAGKVSSG